MVNLAKISVAESTSLKGTNCLSADAIFVIFLLYSKKVSAEERDPEIARLADGFWKFDSNFGVLNFEDLNEISSIIAINEIIAIDGQLPNRLTGVMVQEVQKRFTGGQGGEHLLLFRELQVDALRFLLWNVIENAIEKLKFD